ALRFTARAFAMRWALSPKQSFGDEFAHHLKLGGLSASRTTAWLVFWHPSKRGCPQANWVTLARICRCNNSVGDDFQHQFSLAGIVKLFEGSLVSFTHG